MNVSKASSLLLATVISLFAGGTAQAETIYGLTSSNGFFSFDSATPAVVSTTTTISGIVAGQQIVGMDFRPATGELFAMSYSGTGAAQLYTINPATAEATTVGSGFTISAELSSAGFGFDFNPTVDRIRVTNSSGLNFRVNPGTGAVAGTDTSLSYITGPGNGTPNVTAVAYTNNFAGATTTTLYGYDFNLDNTVIIGGLNGIPSPNGGVVTAIGSSGLSTFASNLGLDISGSGVAYLSAQESVVSGITNGVAFSTNLYTVNLTSGQASLVGPIGFIGVYDIAALVTVPEPGTWAMMVLGGGALGLLALRRRPSA